MISKTVSIITILFIVILAIICVWSNRYLTDIYVSVLRPRMFAYSEDNRSYETETQVFYNRMPKCGSSLTMRVFRNLSAEHSWYYPNGGAGILPYASLKVRSQYWTTNGTLLHKIVNTTLSYRRPVLSSMHVHYIDFTSYSDKKPPVYINLIRDPLDRLVSMYYFIRYSRGHIRPMSRHRRNMDLYVLPSRSYDECVQTNDPECTSPDPSGYFTLVPYFCGHEEICRYPNKVALERAKLHARQHAVIGLLERYDDFLVVLEHCLPQFFRGASAVYAHLKDTDQEYVNRNEHRTTEPLNEATVAKMHQLLEMENEFYTFINERFDKKLASP